MVELQQSLKKINQLLYTRHQTCMTAGSQTVPE